MGSASAVATDHVQQTNTNTEGIVDRTKHDSVYYNSLVENLFVTPGGIQVVDGLTYAQIEEVRSVIQGLNPNEFSGVYTWNFRLYLATQAVIKPALDRVDDLFTNRYYYERHLFRKKCKIHASSSQQ